jgi:opacity protein-like surface antigen
MEPKTGAKMRRCAFLSTLLLMALLTANAEAKNMHGKFGAGYSQSLLGVRGLTFGYWSAPDLQLSLTVGAGFLLDDKNRNTTTILTSVGMKYVLVATKTANLSAGVRACLGWSSRQETTAEESVVQVDTNVAQWGLEAPIEVEYCFSDAFSVFLATGVTFTMVPEGGPLLSPEGLGAVDQVDHKGVGIGVGGLFGSAGFAFYF